MEVVTIIPLSATAIAATATINIMDDSESASEMGRKKRRL